MHRFVVTLGAPLRGVREEVFGPFEDAEDAHAFVDILRVDWPEARTIVQPIGDPIAFVGYDFRGRRHA